MPESESSPKQEKLPQAAIFERLFGKSWDSLPTLNPKNIPLIFNMVLLDGPQIWVPFSSAVKDDRGYDCRINFPPNLDKIIAFLALNHMDDIVGEVPPRDHIKHLLKPDEELGEAARKILSWWNPNATIRSEAVEVVAVKDNKGGPRGLIYYHKGLRLPEKSKVYSLSPNPISSPIRQMA